MKKKMFLTSAIAMGFVAPAFAEPSHTDTFPDDGYMQEDYTYTNAATADNMDSVYEGTVNAVAEYDVIDYILTAGKYLPKDSETITTCPAGSFCSGIGSVQYNETSAQGIESCPSGFGSSETGSSSNTQCYRACDINNVGTSVTAIAHATAISGNDYYGSGADTCTPTSCENGYHVGGLDVVFKTPIVPIDYNDTATDYGYISADGEGTHQSTNYGLTNNNTWAAEYEDGTIVSGRASCQASPTSDNQALLYIANNLETLQSGEMQFSEFKAGVAQLVGNEKANLVEKLFGQYTAGTISENEAFALIWGLFSINEDANYATNSTGEYCYCQMTGYTPNGGTLQSLSSSWVFGNYFISDASSCASDCVSYCAQYMGIADSYNLAFRAALFGSAGASAAICEANTITINWSNASATDIATNNAGTATYGEDVRTPVKAETIKGKTFKGWRFSKPEQTTTGGGN